MQREGVTMLMSVSLRQDIFAMDRLAQDGEMDAAINVASEAKETTKRKALFTVFGKKARAAIGSALRKGHRVLAICDEDERYLNRLDCYLSERLTIPFEIREYTSVEKLCEGCKDVEPTILLISGSFFRELKKLRTEPFADVIVLEDPEEVRYEEEVAQEEADDAKWRVSRMNKFVSAERVLNAVLDRCLSCSQVMYAGNDFPGNSTGVIGVYSPLSRCLQSTYALTLGQELAKKGKVLYFSFEPYASLPEICDMQEDYDLADFLYLVDCYPGKLSLYLEKVCQKAGAVDVIPPARNFLSVRSVKMERWEDLFHRITFFTDYAYVIMDLNECMASFVPLLERCDRVFTPSRTDAVSRARMERYRHLLSENGMDEVWDRTVEAELPLYRDLPVRIAEFTQGALAQDIRKVLDRMPALTAREAAYA